MSAACQGRTVTARHVRRGRPDVEIVGCAAAMEADLVVVGTHGRSGLPHVLLGSVAERVVRTSPVPVVTVPASWAARASRDPLIRRILAPTDLDAGGETRVAEIVGMAERLGAHVDLLSVLDLSPYLLRHDAIRADVEGATHRDLAELAKRHLRPGTRVDTHVRVGQPGDTIVAVAGELDVDLVALPTHARTGASRFFLGSVAERVARTARCPVLTLRPGAGARS